MEHEVDDDLTLEKVSTLKVDELKAALKKRGVSFGNKEKKADLVEKLELWFNSKEESQPNEVAPELAQTAAEETRENEVNGEKKEESDKSENEAKPTSGSEETQESSDVVPDDKISKPSGELSEVTREISSPRSSTAEKEEQRLRELVLQQKAKKEKLAQERLEADMGAVARHDVGEKTLHLRIDNFQRPLTIRSVVSFINDLSGLNLEEADIWVNSIKTHCYVDFKSSEDAERCIKSVAGQRFNTSPKPLICTYTSTSAAEAASSKEATLLFADWLKKRHGNTAEESFSPSVSVPVSKSPNGAESSSRGDNAAVATTTPSPRSGGVLSRLGGHTAGVFDVMRRAAAQAADTSTNIGGSLSKNSDTRKHKLPEADSLSPREKVDAEVDRSAKRLRRGSEGGSILDKLFRKTSAVPPLFWIPVTEAIVAERERLVEANNGKPYGETIDRMSIASPGFRRGVPSSNYDNNDRNRNERPAAESEPFRRRADSGSWFDHDRRGGGGPRDGGGGRRPDDRDRSGRPAYRR